MDDEAMAAWGPEILTGETLIVGDLSLGVLLGAGPNWEGLIVSEIRAMSKSSLLGEGDSMEPVSVRFAFSVEDARLLRDGLSQALRTVEAKKN